MLTNFYFPGKYLLKTCEIRGLCYAVKCDASLPRWYKKSRGENKGGPRTKGGLSTVALLCVHPSGHPSFQNLSALFF